MKENNYKQILERLISYPIEDQIEMHFDLKKSLLSFSVPIFKSSKRVPKILKDYVQARKGKTFLPHKTSFSLDREKQVFLKQELFLEEGPFPGATKDAVQEFCKMAKSCHRMFVEMATEEIYKNLRN